MLKTVARINKRENNSEKFFKDWQHGQTSKISR